LQSFLIKEMAKIKSVYDGATGQTENWFDSWSEPSRSRQLIRLTIYDFYDWLLLRFLGWA
jgi:hypothetical protein